MVNDFFELRKKSDKNTRLKFRSEMNGTERGLLFLPLLKDDVLAKICPDNGRREMDSKVESVFLSRQMCTHI